MLEFGANAIALQKLGRFWSFVCDQAYETAGLDLC